MNRDDIIWSKIQVAISRSTSLTDLEKVALGCQIRAAIVDGIEAWEDDRRDAVISPLFEVPTRGALGRWLRGIQRKIINER